MAMMIPRTIEGMGIGRDRVVTGTVTVGERKWMTTRRIRMRAMEVVPGEITGAGVVESCVVGGWVALDCCGVN